jgi:glycosyltransferase involved in cell wall biosynthesis
MLSIIIPFYNEKESLPLLLNKLKQVLAKIHLKSELILVDDGSSQKYQLEKLSLPYQLVRHRKRLGKGRALANGFLQAKGEIIVFMDADLQDDPEELPKFIEKINQGYDLVNGWRKKREDNITKIWPSFIFNQLLLKMFFKSNLNDINCGYKAMRREVLEQIPLYGDNYRFLPIIAQQEGFRTTQVEVKHHKRLYGRSKYGFWRLFFGLIDTLTTYFIYRFSEKPLHFFGPIGAIIFGSGFIISLILTLARIFYHTLLYRRVILQLGILLMIVGVQIMMTGIVAELIVFLDKKQKNKI